MWSVLTSSRTTYMYMYLRAVVGAVNLSLWLTTAVNIICNSNEWILPQFEIMANLCVAVCIPCRGFIKGRAPGKLTGCEQDLSINLPRCFYLFLLLSFIRKTKNAWLKNGGKMGRKNGRENWKLVLLVSGRVWLHVQAWTWWLAQAYFWVNNSLT